MLAKHYEEIVGARGSKKRSFAYRKSSTVQSVYETINWNGRLGNYLHPAWFVVVGPIRKGHCGNVRWLRITR